MSEFLFDVNNQGNPFRSSLFDTPNITLDRLVGIPQDVTAPAPIPAGNPTILQQVANFFRPRTITLPGVQPMKCNPSFGDEMIMPCDPHSTRLYFINLNGLNLQKDAVQFRDLCEEIRKADIDVFAAAEHNLDSNKYVVRQALQTTARKSFNHHCLQTATSSIQADKFYKPGGTLLLAQGDIVGRIKERGSDSLGRWSWMKLLGCNKRLITIISAYQVCTRPTHRTGTTAYHQQQSLLRQKGAKKANPRKFFHRDLQEFVRRTKSRNESVILVGDFNEPMNERSSMARIASTHSLVDILFQRNSHLPEPNTYVRGSNRIDYALITPDLLPAVQRCGYEPFQKRVTSDHRGLFLDFNTNLLFGNDTQPLGPLSMRDFTAKSAANNSKYIEAKHAC
jgi:hypothetical protein